MDSHSLFSVKGKVVLITGGNKGIGAMLSEGFVKNGCTVFIVARDTKKSKEISDRLNAMGSGTCTPILADISDNSQIKDLAEKLDKLSPKGIHVLINNAGITYREPFETHSVEMFNKVVHVDLNAQFAIIKAIFPLLKKTATTKDPGRIINISSINAIAVNPYESYGYAAAKSGIIHLTRVLASNFGKYHITVNSISPGPFESSMTKDLMAKRAEIEPKIPLGRVGTSEDIAGTCIYLASRAGAYTTGAMIQVDGGVVVLPFKL